jgi:carbon storage regulator
MLVLSRKRLEQIVIGSDIRITVVRVEGSHVRLGIEAPHDLTVLRAELLDPDPARECAAHQAAPPPVPRKG